jgi:hypothetical protein
VATRSLTTTNYCGKNYLVAARSFLLYGGLLEHAWGWEILLSSGHQIGSIFFLLLKQFAVHVVVILVFTSSPKSLGRN